jgi:two-component system LytT family response regulator
MLTTVIIDDDEISIFVLVSLLKNLSSFEIDLVGTASNLEDGVEMIKKTHPDLVFLDINMPGKKGLEIFNEFKKPFFKIIFCTVYRQYAIDVLRIASCGYLLKPIEFMDLREAVEKVALEISREKKQLVFEDKLNYLFNTEIPGENVLFDVENGFIVLNTRNIEYCYVKHPNTIIVTYDRKEIVIDKTLKQLHKYLPVNQFYRPHNNYLINVYYIRKYVQANDSFVVMKSGIKIPVSKLNTLKISEDIIDMMRPSFNCSY